MFVESLKVGFCCGCERKSCAGSGILPAQLLCVVWVACGLFLLHGQATVLHCDEVGLATLGEELHALLSVSHGALFA